MPRPVTELEGRRVVVMGLGRFGGGVGVARHCAKHGSDVLVTDTADADALEKSLDQLADLPITYRLGEHNVSDFTTADLIVVNPAVDPRENRFLRAARAAGVALTSEMRLLVERLPARERTIGVTGSAGKSTTTAMIGHILGSDRGTERPSDQGKPTDECAAFFRGISPRVFVGGNLGGSLLDQVNDMTADDWVVLELSSFMLEDLAADRWSPHIAVITNFAANHLDRHGSVEAYREAKRNILAFQDRATDKAVLGPGMRALFPSEVHHIASCEADDVPRDPAHWTPLLTPGYHNQLNARLAALAVEQATGLRVADAYEALRDFPGLPHRLQFVAEHAGVRFFNDSKSTTPQAAQLALTSFPGHGVHIILGGYDKQSDLGELAQCAAREARAAYTIGDTGDAIADAVDAAGGQAVRCGTLERAMHTLADRVRSGDVVLLSPGCASWDQFENYEARGRAFGEAILHEFTERPRA